MIIIECKNIPKLYETLVITNKRCYIQQMEQDAVLVEYKIPILFDNGEPLELNIFINDYIMHFLKNRDIIKIFKTYLDFGDAKCPVKHCGVLVSSLPELSCICNLPDTDFEEEITLQVVDSKLIIEMQEFTFSVPTLYSKNSPSVKINSAFLPSGLCKVYIDNECPIGIETDEKILYIAPICTP